MAISIKDIQQYLTTRARCRLHDPEQKAAAVLILLVGTGESLRIIFNLRSESVEHHKGQVSFPGGLCEPEDGSFEVTALREAQEEIGVEPDSVTILGLHDDLVTPTGFVITPVIGHRERMPEFVLNPTEVEQVFDVPLAFFLDPQKRKVELRERLGILVESPVYRFGEFEIWGATAIMLTRFLDGLLSTKKAL